MICHTKCLCMDMRCLYNLLKHGSCGGDVAEEFAAGKKVMSAVTNSHMLQCDSAQIVGLR